MSYRLACELSDKIAAIAPVAGSYISYMLNSCNPTHATPVYIFMELLIVPPFTMVSLMSSLFQVSYLIG